MSTYVIGDIQGCYSELQELLRHIMFDAAEDQLWFTGDLVNRGPQSLEVLRFVKGLGSSAITVLGNHDLHCLALAYGFGKAHRYDTLDAVLAAPDADELMTWLRQQPLMYVDEQAKIGLIHAGLAPEWDIPLAKRCAAELEQTLRGEAYREYFQHMYGNQPERWSAGLKHWDRLRFITNCFTRLRYVDSQGNLCLEEKGAPGTQSVEQMPWFQHPGRASTSHRLLFGHWSTLGYYANDNVIGLDTGCLWGGAVTAVKLSANHATIEQVYQQKCDGNLTPSQNEFE